MEHDGFHIEKYGCNKIVETFNENEIFITPETKELPNVRCILVKGYFLLVKKLKDYLTRKEKIKKYLSSQI